MPRGRPKDEPRKSHRCEWCDELLSSPSHLYSCPERRKAGDLTIPPPQKRKYVRHKK